MNLILIFLFFISIIFSCFISIKLRNSNGYGPYSEPFDLFIFSEQSSTTISNIASATSPFINIASTTSPFINIASTLSDLTTSSDLTKPNQIKSNTGVIIGSVLGSVGGVIFVSLIGYFVWKYELLSCLKPKKVKPSNDIPLKSRV